MINLSIFSFLVTLIMGVALLLLWRRYRAARFTRDIGLYYLALAITPFLFSIYSQAGDRGQTLVLWGTVAFGSGYLTLLLLGMVHLAQRQISWAKIAAIILSLSLLMGYTMFQHSWPFASTVSGLITFSVGAIAWRWLWASEHSDRWAGPLLCLMGVAQCAQLAFGVDATAFQFTLNTLLRLVLGLVLFQTALQRVTTEAHRLREQFERLTWNSHQGVAIAYTQEIIYCNPAFLKIYGLTSLVQISPEWINAAIPEDELAAVMTLRHRVLDGTLEDAAWEGPRRRLDGTALRLRFAIWRTEWEGQPALQTVITDDTEHHDTMAALLHQATHDELTGLPNRGALLRRLRERCQTSRPDETFALLLLDIDRFKLFNDAYGHSMGDEVLKALTETLQRELTGVAELSRLGSDGFALLGRTALDAAQAQDLAQRVQRILAWPLVLPEQEFFVDASIGLALYPETGTEAESLLRAANAAMHEAKKIAGTSVVVAEQRFVLGSAEVLEQEQALRAGIINREFSLAYQPKVDSVNGALMGFEALARWHRAGVDAVSPVQFIAAAERTGLIGSLGMLLLSQACEQLLKWHEESVNLVPVAVNVSPLQLLDPGFPQLVGNTLKRYGVAPEWISLEVTESAAIGNMEQALAQLIQLRDLGLKVALDDFGTGFSSLAMLRTLPLSVVKIDRSLIDPMPAPDAIAVVQAICQLAATLKLRVVAEGVETEAQADAAQRAGCHEIQGYFYARPLSPEQALKWLLAGTRPIC